MSVTSERKKRISWKTRSVLNARKRVDTQSSKEVVNDMEVLVYENTRLVIPDETLQERVMQWYHYFLQNPGHTQFKETLKPVM